MTWRELETPKRAIQRVKSSNKSIKFDEKRFKGLMFYQIYNM